MKIAFQEQLLDELNQALVQQQFDMDKIQLQLRYLAGKLKICNLLILLAKQRKLHLRIIKQ